MHTTTAITITIEPCPYCPLSAIGSFPILLEPSRVIGNIRTMISELYIIPVDKIYLEYGGKTLHNTDTLEEHGISYSSVIDVCTSGLSPRDYC